MRYIHPLALVLATSCAPTADECIPAAESYAIADEVREASGVAASRTHAGVLWTHNDSEGAAAIFAIDTSGRLLGRVALEGAQNRDWEDIAVARCPRGGPDGDCVYVADIGDNRAARDGVAVWVVPESDPHATSSVKPAFVRLYYPDGARDAEALVVLDDGSLLVITKGRDFPVAVYRSPPLTWAPDTAAALELEMTQQLTDGPVDLPIQVTGAALGTSGRLAVRTYSTLQFYRLDGHSLAPIGDVVRLDSLAEPQGEGVALDRAGRVYLASEAGPQGIAPRLTLLGCRAP